MLPEIERQQQTGKEVAFRRDATFARPEVYEALEEFGVRYCIRIPANDSLATPAMRSSPVHEALVKHPLSHTGKYLARFLDPRAPVSGRRRAVH